MEQLTRLADTIAETYVRELERVTECLPGDI